MVSNGFQHSVGLWARLCFGDKVAADRRIRNFRFLEEALELVQAAGCTKEEALQLVDYVYNRPVGELPQELGGTMVTLAAWAEAHGLDMTQCGWIEQRRCEQPEVMEKIRRKQASKIGTSPLPGTGETK
jgi:hypothetical protein